MKISFCNNIKNTEKQLIKQVFSAAINYLRQYPKIQVEIMLTDETEIKRLNKEFRSIDAETDVLSFANIDICGGDTIKPENFPLDTVGGNIFLGSIAICRQRVVSQAEQYGHSEQRELAFLALHGLLHLLGYDHETDDGKMLYLSEQILHSLDITR